jgi:hypothetical protein
MSEQGKTQSCMGSMFKSAYELPADVLPWLTRRMKKKKAELELHNTMKNFQQQEFPVVWEI